MRKEQPLQGVLKGIISDLGKKAKVTREDMARAWRIAVGKKASTHTRVVAIKRGRLTVNVDRSSWLYELTLKKKVILKKISSKFKDKKIKDIRFRIGEVKEGINGEEEKRGKTGF